MKMGAIQRLDTCLAREDASDRARIFAQSQLVSTRPAGSERVQWTRTPADERVK